jgi:LacI family transcriptional regulator
MVKSRSARVTLADLAAASGVSKATASLVLNDQPGVAQATREIILSVARDMGYRPNRAAQEVARGVTTTINVVLSPTQHQPELPNYYLMELLAGAEAESSQSGYQILVSTWDGNMSWAPDLSAAGILYLGGSFPPSLLVKASLPAVLIGSAFPQWPYDAVLVDNSRGAYLAVDHLFTRGSRRIALINGPDSTRTSELKLLGYKEALLERQIPFDPALIRSGDFSINSGYWAAKELFSGASQPDGLFVADDPMAIGALHALQDLGIEIPERVRVVGYGESPMGEVVRPSLTTIKVFQGRMGRLGMMRLIGHLRGELDTHVRILVGPELVMRSSS